MNDKQAHWDSAYIRKGVDELSWYQRSPALSLQLIDACGVSADEAIIDVGGGASRLVDHLIERGYRNLSVLDISPEALRHARQRLGSRADQVEWLEADITAFEAPQHYRLWHDRAVFHFLTDPDDQARYRSVLERSLLAGGHLIVATFGLDGPERCSGLPIARYDVATLSEAIGDKFELLESLDEQHVRPAGGTQHFLYCRFQRL